MLQVFSAFGFVHKIATFEKTAGFQVVLCEEVFDPAEISLSFSFS